jgi:lipopolysaccharide/colanic/teichoic acid biosynthesis glycosyltransferase
MLNLPFKNNPRRRKKGLPTGSLLEGAAGLYGEEYFKEMLCLERKRTERSRKPFLLMLLDIGDLLAASGQDGVVPKTSAVLASTTREIDVKGWYLTGSVIGVIYTEMGDADKGLLSEKTDRGLREAFGEQAEKIAITLHLFPETSGPSGPGCGPDPNLYPDLSRRDSSSRGSQLLKRATDIAGAILGLALFSPFFVVIPLLIKLTSRGPVFFRQQRVGRFGRMFTFLKFRSMHVNVSHKVHEEYVNNLICGNVEGGAGKQCVYKIQRDSRVTPMGRFLRKTSLDELPQFFNVLMGDMSLVGPRPPIPYELKKYDIWHRRRVLEVKPGITGLWQVKGRSRTTFDEMVRLDLKYVREWSLWLDIKILLLTPFAVLNGKGAY